jgi:hypothetical protein
VQVLEFLVTSRARRSLIEMYLSGELEGSVSDVARRARIRPSTAERELRRMAACGLVELQREGKERVVRVRSGGPASALKALQRPAHRLMTSESQWERVRAQLVHFGAPLFVRRREMRAVPRLENVLAAGLRLSHQDPAVAGNLPVVLAKNPEVDVGELARLAARDGEGQTLGFFLELTDQLSGAGKFAATAALLRDKRLKKARNFFSVDGGFGAHEEQLAVMHTPEVAKRWNYLMNMSLESFQSYFRKGTETTQLRLAPR